MVVELKYDDKKPYIIIYDNNGKPIPEEIVNSINRKDVLNVNQIVSSGFGLPIVKSFMKVFQGDFLIQHFGGRNIFTLSFKRLDV